MKIALVIYHADPARGGAERYTVDLASALAIAGHEVSLLTASSADIPAGVCAVLLQDDGWTRSAKYSHFLDSLDTHLNAAHYDIVHAMLPVRRCDVYHPHAGLAAAAFDSPKKKLQALFNPRRRAFAAVERALLASPTPPLVIALSEYVKRSIRRWYALEDARLPILFNAVDLNRFQPEPHPPRDKVVGLFVGQDFARKGVTEAVAAVQQISDPRLSLTIVGRKPRGFHLPPMKNITQIGAAADPRPFYREADFFVLPTKHDPCSLVVLEALTMGLPVISTKFNGACEIMTDGVHGYILDDPRDVDALADRMKRLLDSDLRARMSAACLALRPRLSYEHHLATLMSVYEKVVRTGKMPVSQCK